MTFIMEADDELYIYPTVTTGKRKLSLHLWGDNAAQNKQFFIKIEESWNFCQKLAKHQYPFFVLSDLE